MSILLQSSKRRTLVGRNGVIVSKRRGGIAWLNQGTWTIGAASATNAPNPGSELLTNGDFANWTADNPDNWTVVGESGNDPEVSEVGSGEAHGGSGTGAANFFNTSTANQPTILQSAGVVGNWYAHEVDISSLTNGDMRVESGGTNSLTMASVATHRRSLRQTDNSIFILRVIGDPVDITADSYSVKQLALNELITVQDVGASDVIAASKIAAHTYGTLAGLAVCVDDHDNPQNMVIVSHNGVQVVVEKRVAGTWSSVSSTVAAFSASAELRVEKSGSTFEIYYNGSLIKTDTISDAGIISNTQHGLFSTYSANTLTDFSFAAN